MLSFLSFALLSLLSVSTAEDRNCYQTSSGDYFTNYVFNDFRTSSGSLPPIPDLPDTLPKGLIPQQSEYSANPKIGQLQDGFVKSPEWTKSWAIQDWGKLPTSEFPVRMQNSLSNVYLVSNDTKNSSSKLVLRTHRFDGFQSTAEVESLTRNLFYASIRIRLRVQGASGACAGLFIFQNGRNESDIEILTRDPKSTIRYSNQPVLDRDGNEVPGASTEVNLQSKAKIAWDEWHTHRIDWVKGKSSWFVDDSHYFDTHYSVPTVPSYFVMNMWSDGGVWSGEMAKDQTAVLEIEFVEMAYNTSGSERGYSGGNRKEKRGGKDKCTFLSAIDGVSVTGKPEALGPIAGASAVAIPVRWLTFLAITVAMLSYGL